MKQQFLGFLIRWALNSVGLWLAVKLFGTGLDPEKLDGGFFVFVIAGLVFSIINSVLRPIVMVLSLPAILLTLGLFTFIVNGLMVYVSLKITPGIAMTFWHSVLTGIVLSLLNYIVSSMLELNRYEPTKKEA